MSDLSKVIETQKNRIRYLEREVAQLEHRLARAERGSLMTSRQDFENAMESRFPDTLQATRLSQTVEVEVTAAADAAGESPTREHRNGQAIEVSVSG